MNMGCDDIYLGFMPLFHVAGLATTFSQLILGGTVISAPLPDPEFLYGLSEKHKPTVAFFVSGISVPFVQYGYDNGIDLTTLRLFIAGAGAEPIELIDHVEEKFGAKYYGIYGQTEAGGIAGWVDGDMIRKKQTSYGHVMPFFEYKIVDKDGREVEAGVPGELCLRGRTVMMGYWNRPEATAETLKDNWLHTGDVFIRHNQGNIQMVDRVKYLIKTGGENVYSQEVEMVLHQHEAIADTAVIGVPDPKWGEAIKAFIVLHEGKTLSKNGVAEWVGQSIASYKKPRYIEFVDAIPRNVSGKILKMDLKERETTAEQKV
ncbi:MAG: long-chain fatty acid--CoA ligase [Proteobacteria bacterium]|nr:long-chain fatty acid--CoA ligase [Pseudomonadota bacterium]